MVIVGWRFIILELNELDILICLAILQHIRTCADKIGHIIRLLVSGNDNGSGIIECQQRGQRRIGLLECDHNCGRITRFHIVHKHAGLLAARRRPLDRGDPLS